MNTNTTSDTDQSPSATIVRRHWERLASVTYMTQSVPNDDCIILAMLNAVDEALALREPPAPVGHVSNVKPAPVGHVSNVTPAPVGHVSNMPDPRIAEWQQAQIASLNEWLEHHRTDLYFDGNLDTAQAILAALASLDERLVTAIEERTVAEDATRRLRDWLHANVPVDDATGALDDTELVIATITGLRSQLAQVDADEARQRQTAIDLQREIDRLVRQNTIATDAFNSLVEHNGAAGHTPNAPDLRPWLNAEDQDWLEHNGAAGHTPNAPDLRPWLNAEDQDWLESLEKNRRKFGQLPKPTRLHLVQAILKSLLPSSGELPTMATYNEAKPNWAPSASGIPTQFGVGWAQLLTAPEPVP